MKKVSILTSLICALFFVFSSCDSDSNDSSLYAGSQIKDGTKLKITYVVDSAYFELPADAPKYHIYGTDTVLPVPEEKNLLGSLMKAKFWSDGTREDITVLGARDYTKEIRVEYKYSFDTEKCADGYVMIKGECVVAPDAGIIGTACTTVNEERYDFIDNGIIECGSDFKWQFAGCQNGYIYVDGECKEYCDPKYSDNYLDHESGRYAYCDNGVSVSGQCEAGKYFNFNPSKGPIGCIEYAGEACDESYGPWCSRGMFISCKNGILVAEDCGDGERCEHDRGCVDR